MSFLMKFGRYKGQDIATIHRGALEYYLGWSDLRDDAREAIEAELALRDETGEEPEHPAEPTESPAEAPSRPGGSPDIAKAINLIQAALEALRGHATAPRRERTWPAKARKESWTGKPPLRTPTPKDDGQVPF